MFEATFLIKKLDDYEVADHLIVVSSVITVFNTVIQEKKEKKDT